MGCFESPAMEAGLTDHVWRLEELVDYWRSECCQRRALGARENRALRDGFAVPRKGGQSESGGLFPH